jgi:hypothetical protein
MEGLRQSEDVLWRHEAWCGSHGHGEAVHQRGAYPESGGVILAAAYLPPTPHRPAGWFGLRGVVGGAWRSCEGIAVLER